VSPGGGVIGTVISRSSKPQREREEREKRECVCVLRESGREKTGSFSFWFALSGYRRRSIG
jgi:hypothetical protein